MARYPLALLSISVATALLVAGCTDDGGDDFAPSEADASGEEGNAGTNANGPVAAAAGPTPVATPAGWQSEVVPFTGWGTVVGDPTPGCGGATPNGRIGFTWPLRAPETAAEAYVSNMSFVATYAATLPDADVIVFDPDGDQITVSAASETPPTGSDAVDAPGDHPTGVFLVQLRGCVGAGQGSIEGSATLYWLESGEAA